jgi:hypothetical protein
MVRDWQRHEQNLTRSAAARHSSNIARFFQRPQNQSQTNEERSADDETKPKLQLLMQRATRPPIETTVEMPDTAPEDVEINELENNDENVSASAFPSFIY